jgi:hypothetical protein
MERVRSSTGDYLRHVQIVEGGIKGIFQIAYNVLQGMSWGRTSR